MNERKVLLIGWDAADWNVARPLIEQGKMPALKRLMDEGVWGNLATIRPVLSPMLWTSIATGKRAWKHGIHGFSEPCPATSSIRPITNLSRKTKAVWNIFNQQGWQSNVIGWWPSSPAEPINGVMISNHFQQAGGPLNKPWPLRPGTIHPPELAEPYKKFRIHPAELQNEHILPFIPKAAEIDQEKDKRMQMCAKTIAEISSIHAAATAAMQMEPWDFMAVYYDGIDHFGHGFMKYHPPRLPWIKEEDFELYKDVIEAAYRYHDMMLDVLLKMAGDDTTVMLISDHGFEPGNLRPKALPNEPAGPAAEHSPFGIFCLRGPGIKQGEQIHGASLLDITPTLLHLYGLPVGRDMDGKTLVNCFKDEQKVAFIDSWDEVEGTDGRHPQGTQLDAYEARETLRQLVDLGYIDEPDPDQGKAVDETLRELQYNLAQAYMDGGYYNEAAPILQRNWDRWPRENRFGSKLLACNLAFKDATAARATFDLLLQRKAEAVRLARQDLSEIQKVQAEKQKAAEEKGEKAPELSKKEQQRIRRLRGQAHTNPHSLAYFHGCILVMEERYPEALAELQKAEKAQITNLPALNNKIGEVHLKLKDLDAAEDAYSKALAITANAPETRLGLAEIAFERGLYFQAAAEALASIELYFHNPRAQTVYGRALLKLEKFKLGEQALLTAVSQNPNYWPAHEQLAKFYQHRRKNPEKAAHHRKLAEEARKNKARIQIVPEDETAEPITEFPVIEAQCGRLTDADPTPIIIVSGLPRSGTSLMMQMLEAAGLPIVTDGERSADESNPKGYYEDERVKALPQSKDRSWLGDCKGKAIKIVAPLLRYIPPRFPAKVIFMQRPPMEVVRSQRTMLQRDGKTGSRLNENTLAQSYAAQLKAINELLPKRPKHELLPVSHGDALENPARVAREIGEFIGREVDVNAMAAVVDATLYRTKA